MKIIVAADFFEVIDTEDKAYWLGFIAADGNLSNGGQKQFRMSLAAKDRNHLELLRTTMGIPNQLSELTIKLNGKEYPAFRIHYTSVKLFNDLIKQGITPRKSLTLSPPTLISDHLIRHWIRGYFDGDGSVYINKKGYLKIHIAGTGEICNFIAEIIGFGYVNLSSKNLHHVRVYKQSEVRAFYHLIYENSTVFLERKHNKFIEGFNL